MVMQFSPNGSFVHCFVSGFFMSSCKVLQLDVMRSNTVIVFVSVLGPVRNYQTVCQNTLCLSA